MEIVFPARHESLDILPELKPGFADQGTGLCDFFTGGARPLFKTPSSLLLIRDGQEDAIIHGHRAREKSGAVRAHDGHVSGLAAHRRTGEL